MLLSPLISQSESQISVPSSDRRELQRWFCRWERERGTPMSDTVLTDTVGDEAAARSGGPRRSAVPRYRRFGGESRRCLCFH